MCLVCVHYSLKTTHWVNQQQPHGNPELTPLRIQTIIGKVVYFMACPRNPVAFQLLAATCARRPPVSDARLGTGAAPRTIAMSTGLSTSFLTSKAFVTSLLALSFYVIFLSSLLSAKRKKMFLYKQNQTSTLCLSICGN